MLNCQKPSGENSVALLQMGEGQLLLQVICLGGGEDERLVVAAVVLSVEGGVHVHCCRRQRQKRDGAVELGIGLYVALYFALSP